MVVQACRIWCSLLFLACLLAGQQTSTEPSSTFSSESRLVLVPFHVVQGKYFAPDLKPEDILLLEDGKPRDFTVFEGPATGRRPPLELVLLFDTTTLPPPESKIKVFFTHWDREATYEFASQWGEAESRTVLEKGGADVRVSVYQFDHQQLRRLARSTKDPQTLTTAIRRLPEAIPADEAIELELPPGGREYAPRTNRSLAWPLSWTLEAVIATLEDSTATPDNALRVLVVFSERTAWTSTRPEDAADQANALGVTVYPVLLNFEEYLNSPFAISLGDRGMAPRPVDGMILMPRPDRFPDRGANESSSAESRRSDTVGNASTLPMIRFSWLGEMTGGVAVHPTKKRLDAGTVNTILDLVKNRSLAQYIAGFAPPPSEKQRKHRLEIKLTSEDIGELQGGKRTAIY